MKKGYVFGFFVDENEKIIFLSSTFMNGAKVMSSGEYVVFPFISFEHGTFGQVGFGR